MSLSKLAHSKKISALAVGIGMTLYTLLFLILVFWKYQNFHYNALDLAIFNQMLFASAHGHWFASSIHPPSYLGDHFSPILLLLLPFYYLKSSPYILLIAQTMTLVACAMPLYAITNKLLNDKFAIAVVIAWLANPIVQNVTLFEFSALPFAVLLLLTAFYFYQKNSFAPFMLCCALALTVREDVALVVAMFGIIAAIDRKKIAWIVVPIAASLLYFFVALKIIGLSGAGGSYKFFVYYSWLGSDLPSALKTLLTHPWLPLFYLFRLGNLAMLLGLLLPLALVPLINPTYLLLGLPIFLQLALGTPGGSGVVLQTQYGSLLVMAVFIAAIYSLAAIVQPTKRTKTTQLITDHYPLTIIVFLVALIYFALTLGPLPGTLATIATTGWQNSSTVAKQELLSQIPADAAVAATYDYVPQLSSRDQLYSFNYAFLASQQFLTTPYSLPPTSYILVDYSDLITYELQYGSSPFYHSQYQARRQAWPEILKGFGAIKAADSTILYQRGIDNQFKLVEVTATPPVFDKQHASTIDDALTFLGFQTQDDAYQLFWRTTGNVKNYRLQLSLNQNGVPQYQKLYPWAYDQLPVGQTANQFVQTNYFWLSDKKIVPPGTYDLTLQVMTIDGGGIELTADRSTMSIIDHSQTVGPVIPLGTITL